MRYLKELLKKEIYEDDKNEFKLRLNEDLSSFLKEIDAFANSGGGHIYLGVKDGDGELCGYSFEELDSIVNRIENECKQFLRPKISLLVEYLSYEVKDGKRYVIHLTIPNQNKLPIFYCRGTNAVYVRSFSSSVLADPDEIYALFRSSSESDYDEETTDLLYEEGDFSTLFSSYEERSGEKLTSHLLSSLPFYDEKGHLYRGSVLFADNYQGEGTHLVITRFPGISKSGDFIQKLYEGHGNIETMIPQAVEVVRKSSFVGLKKEDFGNKEVASFPYRALTEAVVNAFAHKDYSLEKGLIEINIYKDRLEVVSPGSLLGNKRLYKEKDLLSIAPKRRNELICKVLSLLRYMESAGSGFSKIADCYKDAGPYHKPFINSSLSSFTLVLPDLIYPTGVIDKDNENVTLVYENKEKGSRYDEAILRYCYFEDRDISQIAEKISVKVSSYLRKEIIDDLIRRGLLISYKDGTKIYYRTSQEKVALS